MLATFNDLEDRIFADLHHVLHLDTLDGLSFCIESVDAGKAQYCFADQKRTEAVAAVILGARFGFENVGVEGLDIVGAKVRCRPIHEVDAQIFVVMSVSKIDCSLRTADIGPGIFRRGTLLHGKSAGIELNADLQGWS